MNTESMFTSLSWLGNKLSKGVQGTLATLDHAKEAAKTKVVKAAASGILHYGSDHLIKYIANKFVIPDATELAKLGLSEELAKKGLDLYLEIRRQKGSEQLGQLTEQFYKLFKTHSSSATTLINHFKEEIDFAQLIAELNDCEKNGIAPRKTPTINKLVVLLQKAAHEPELRGTLFALLDSLSTITKDPSLRSSALEILKSKQANDLLNEAFDHYLISADKQGQKVKEFKRQIIATVTNDLWENLAKKETVHKLGDAVDILKENFPKQTDPINESWDAAHSISAKTAVQSLGIDLKGIVKDVVGTGCMSTIVRHLPNSMVEKFLPLIPGGDFSKLKQSIEIALRFRETGAGNEAISTLIEPLVNVYLNSSIQQAILRNKSLNFKDLAKEVHLVMQEPKAGHPTPHLDTLFAELRQLMHDPETRQDILNLLQAFKSVHATPNMKEAVSHLFSTKNSSQFIAQTMSGHKEKLGIAAIENDVIAFLTHDLCSILFHESNAAELQSLGSLVSNKISSSVLTKDAKNPLTIDESANLHADLAEIGQKAKSVATGIIKAAASNENSYKIIKNLPVETVTLIKGQVSSPTVQNGLDTALKLIKNDHFSALLLALGKLATNETVKEAMHNHDIDFKTAFSELLAIETGSVESSTKNLNGIYSEFHLLMQAPEAKTAILQLITAMQEVAKDEDCVAFIKESIKSPHGKSAIAALINNSLQQSVPLNGLKTELSDFLSDNLWNSLAKPKTAEKLAALAKYLIANVNNFVPNEESILNVNLAPQQTANLKEITTMAKEALLPTALDLTKKAQKKKLLNKVIKVIPASLSETIGVNVTNPLLKKGLDLLLEVQQDAQGSSALAQLIAPLTSLYLNPSFQKILKVKDLDFTTLSSEVIKVVHDAGGETPQLNRLLASLELMMQDAEARSALKSLIEALKTIANDPEMRAAGKELAVKHEGAYGAFTGSLCEMIYELAGWSPMTETLKSKGLADSSILNLITEMAGFEPDKTQVAIKEHLKGKLWETLSNQTNAATFDALTTELTQLIQKYEADKNTPVKTAKMTKELVKSAGAKAADILAGSAATLAASLIKTEKRDFSAKHAENLYNTPGFERAPAAAKLFAELTDQYLLTAMQKYPVDPKSPAWTDFFKTSAAGLIAGTAYAENHGQVKDALENLYLKLLSNLAQTLEAKAAADPEFMPGLTAELINVFVDFLDKLNDVTDKGKHDLSEGELLSRFNDPKMGIHSLKSNKGREERVATIFKETGDRLIALLLPEGAKGLDLGVDIPKPARDALWNLLTDIAVPNALGSLFNLILSENTANNAMLTSLKNLEATLDAPSASSYSNGRNSPTSPKNGPMPTPAQLELNEASGNLLKQVSKILPWSAFSLLMKSQKIKAISGEWLGGIIYKQLTRPDGWTANKIINSALENGLPNLHYGRWSTDADGHPRFVPLDASGAEIPNFKLEIPVTPADIASADATRKAAHAKTAAELKEASVRIADKAIHKGMRQIVVNKCIQSVNWFLSFFLEESTIRAFTPIIEFIAQISYTFTIGLVWFLLRPLWLWHLRSLSEKSIGHARNPMIESPIHNGIEAILDALS